MKHEVFGEKVEIEETDVTFESIYNKPFIPQDYIEDIKKVRGIGDSKFSQIKNLIRI